MNTWQDVLQLEPQRRRPLRTLLPFCVFAILLLWLTPVQPTVIFWFGVMVTPVLALLQVTAALFYLKLMPICQAQMNEIGAKGLATYLQRQLERAYGRLLDDTRLVLVLTALNIVAPLMILFNAQLIPTFLWTWLAVFAFGSALFSFYVVLGSSKIILEMFNLLLRRTL